MFVASHGDARMPRNEHDAAGIAGPILHYLREHPDAADTADGIRQWWLPRQGVTRSVDDVEAALDDLVERGIVARIDRPGMPTVYRRARRRNGESGAR